MIEPENLILAAFRSIAFSRGLGQMQTAAREKTRITASHAPQQKWLFDLPVGLSANARTGIFLETPARCELPHARLTLTRWRRGPVRCRTANGGRIFLKS